MTIFLGAITILSVIATFVAFVATVYRLSVKIAKRSSIHGLGSITMAIAAGVAFLPALIFGGNFGFAWGSHLAGMTGLARIIGIWLGMVLSMIAVFTILAVAIVLIVMTIRSALRAISLRRV